MTQVRENIPNNRIDDLVEMEENNNLPRVGIELNESIEINNSDNVVIDPRVYDGDIDAVIIVTSVCLNFP